MKICGRQLLMFGVGLTAVFFSMPSAADAALSISGTGTASTTQNATLSITDLQLTGPSASTTPVKLLVSNGTLAIATTTGLTFTGGTSGATLYFSGTVEDINAGLASLTYTRTSTGSDTLEVSLVEPGEVFFSENGHLYEYIASAGDWNAAKTKAEALTRYGATGYLTTILSAEENSFVSDRLENDGWMGASDSASEGDWKWVTGPETGTSFWSGDENGSTVDDNYANWNAGEPNDSSGNEDCAQFYVATGRWNDLPCSGSSLSGYVAEFGAPGDMPEVVAAEKTIVTASGPTAVAFSPLDDAIDVSVATTLSITFDFPVSASTGDITIKRAADDTTVETIAANSSSVSGLGSNTITIQPATLPYSTEAYVLIDNSAFVDDGNNAYTGISSDTTWTFTTTRGGGRRERQVAPNAPTIQLYQKDEAVIVDGTYFQDNIETDEVGFTYGAKEADVDDYTSVIYTTVPDSFRKTLRDLACDTDYLLEGYAKNSITTTYTEKIPFTTNACVEIEENVGEDAGLTDDSTLSALRTRLAELTKRLAQLLSNRVGSIVSTVEEVDTAATNPTNAFFAARDLSLGDVGDDVAELQLFLINANAGPSAGELARVGATGYFGTYTENALSEYQQVHMINPPNGYYGDITRAYMRRF